MTAVLLILLYSGLFSWWLMRSNSLNNTTIPRIFLLLAFWAKVVAGIVYGMIYYDYFGGGDTMLYLEESQRIYNTFIHYPDYYMQSLLGVEGVVVPNADVFTYPEATIFWKDLGTYTVVHLNALLHPLTGGYYNVHIVFIAMLGTLAGIRFFRVFRQGLDIPLYLLYGICFFLPSLLFWTSGLHKDILVYYGLSYILAGLFATSSEGCIRWKSIFWGLLMVAMFRHYLIVLLVPTILGYWWSSKGKGWVYSKYLTIYVGGALAAIFILPMLSHTSVWTILANKQAAFLAENGATSFYQTPLDGSFGAVLMALPEAWFNVALRPFLWECIDFWQGVASIEIILFWGVLFIGMFYMDTNKLKKPLVGFLFFYALSNWLLIGLLVSNTGTIVRYRAIALSFFILIIAQLVDYKKLSLLFRKRKINDTMGLDNQLPVLNPVTLEDKKEPLIINP